jgi:hypothetical protein
VVLRPYKEMETPEGKKVLPKIKIKFLQKPT